LHPRLAPLLSRSFSLPSGSMTSAPVEGHATSPQVADKTKPEIRRQNSEAKHATRCATLVYFCILPSYFCLPVQYQLCPIPFGALNEKAACRRANHDLRCCRCLRCPQNFTRFASLGPSSAGGDFRAREGRSGAHSRARSFSFTRL